MTEQWQYGLNAIEFQLQEKSNRGEDMKGQFVDLYASADYLGPGAIEIDRYQTEIFDIVRRRGVFGQRIKQVPAAGILRGSLRRRQSMRRRPRWRLSTRATLRRRWERRRAWRWPCR